MKRIYSKTYKKAWGTRRWGDVPASLSFEIFKPDPVNWVVESTKKPLGANLSQYLNSLNPNEDYEDAYHEVVIEYVSSGYEDPGVRTLPNGDPGYPPEGDNEKAVTGVYLRYHNADGSNFQVPQPIQDEFESVFESEIEEDESWIEGSYDNYEPDYDPDY